MENYRVIINWQDSKGWKWGQSIPLWGGTLAGALEAGRLYMEHVNANPRGETIVGYEAYAVTGLKS